MIKKIIEGGKSGAEFDLHIDGDRGDASYTLVRAGKRWDESYQGSKSIKVTSDGNKVEATIYKGAKGRQAETITLGFDEAAELAYTLLEYAKGDPHAPSPLYEVLDQVDKDSVKVDKVLAKVDKPTKKKRKKAKRVRAENPLYGDRCGG